MLTAATFGSGIHRIVKDAGGLDQVDRRSLARVLGQFELLFRQYIPSYPHDRFTPGLKFLLRQGCPRQLVGGVQLAWLVSTGERERTAANLTRGVTAGVKFAQWWHHHPDFLEGFARHVEKMQSAAPEQASQRMRQSGQKFRVIAPDEPDDVWADAIPVGEAGDTLDVLEPIPVPEASDAGPSIRGDRPVRAPARPEGRRPRRKGPAANAEQILDAQLPAEDLRQSANASAGRSELLDPASAPGKPRRARRKPRPDDGLSAGEKARRAALAEARKALTAADPTARGTSQPPVPPDPEPRQAVRQRVKPRPAAAPAQSASERTMQEFLRKSKTKIAELGRQQTNATNRAKQLEEADTRTRSQLRELLAKAERAKAAALESIREWEEARSRVAELSRRRAPQQKIEAAKKQRHSAAEKARETKETARLIATRLRGIREKATEIARARATAVKSAKAAATARQQTVAAMRKRVAARTAPAPAESVGASAGDGPIVVTTPAEMDVHQLARAVTDAIPVDGPALEEEDVFAVRSSVPMIPVSSAEAIPVDVIESGPALVVTRSSPGKPQPRSGRVVAVSPSARRAVARRGPSVSPRGSSAPPKQSALRSVVRERKTGPAEASAPPSGNGSGPPTPPARAVAPKSKHRLPAPESKATAGGLQDANPDNVQRKLDTIDRTLFKPPGPAPYEAFRLFLQRSALLSFIDSDHADIPSADTIQQMKQEIAEARKSMGNLPNAPDWATLIHVWLLSVYGPRTYVMLSQLKMRQTPWNLPEGQRVSLLLVSPPFVWLFRRPRGTGFIREPRISLLQLNPWACQTGADRRRGDVVPLTLAYTDRDKDGSTIERHVIVDTPVTGGMTAQQTRQQLADFLGDLLTIRQTYIDHVFQRQAARRFTRGNFDHFLAASRRALATATLPERVAGSRDALATILRDGIFHTRPSELYEPEFGQLIDLALQHKVLVGADVRRRAQRIRDAFGPDNRPRPQGTLENLALDFRSVLLTLLDDRAPAARRDRAWDDDAPPPAKTSFTPPRPFTGVEGDPDGILVRLVTEWARGILPDPARSSRPVRAASRLPVKPAP